MLFRGADNRTDCRCALATRPRSFGHTPGFGYLLDPNGDPRGQMLISLAKTYGRPNKVELAKRLIQASHALTGEYSDLDFGLVAFTRALGLSSEAPLAKLTLVRTIGRIAQPTEQ